MLSLRRMAARALDLSSSTSTSTSSSSRATLHSARWLARDSSSGFAARPSSGGRGAGGLGRGGSGWGVIRGQARRSSSACHALARSLFPSSPGGDEDPSAWFAVAEDVPATFDDCQEVVLGIDPDRSGAIAILSSRARGGAAGGPPSVEVEACVIDVPVHKVAVGKTTKGRERIDASGLARLIRSLDLPRDRTVAFLEGGGVEYHFSSYSAFVQGLGVGIWEGVLSHAEIPLHKINSKTWKTLFGLVASKKRTGGAASMAETKEKEEGGAAAMAVDDGSAADGTAATTAKQTKKKKHKRAGQVKEGSVALAREIFPHLGERLSPKGKHGRADALLIASYGHLVRVQVG